MLKDKVQEQERTLSELICYKDQLIETQQQLKESQHTALTTTQQAEVTISTNMYYSLTNVHGILLVVNKTIL